MIKAVLFDFGGVLAENGRRGFVTGLIAELYGQPVEKVDLSRLKPSLRNGPRQEREFFEALNMRYGRVVTPEQYVQKTQSLCQQSGEVYELAARLRNHGIQTGIVSNVFGPNARELRRLGCYDNFDPVILSSIAGVMKPDPRIYQLALQKLNVSAHEVLFIDDQDFCLEGASRAGMRVLKADSPAQIVADTQKLFAQEGLQL